MALRIATKQICAVGIARFVPLVEPRLLKRHASAMAVPTASLPENVGHNISVRSFSLLFSWLQY